MKSNKQIKNIFLLIVIIFTSLFFIIPLQAATEESLWDGCDSLLLRHPSLQEYVWRPLAFEEFGELEISSTKTEGTGSIHWTVSNDEIPASGMVSLHRSYHKDSTEFLELKLRVKCEDSNHPEIYLQWLNYTDNKFPAIQLLSSGEVTNGWKQITLNLSFLYNQGLLGNKLDYLRIYSYVAWFDVGEEIDIYIDDLRIVTNETEDVTPNPNSSWNPPAWEDYIIFGKNYLEKGNHYTIPTDEDLVAYWRQEENSWNGSANEVKDFSGNENHGQAYGGVTTSSDGKLGRCGSFDGINDHIRIPSTNNLKYTGAQFSGACWFKIDQADDSISWILSKPWNANGQYNWGLRYINGYLQLWLQGSTIWGTSFVEGLQVNKGSWYHAAFVVDTNKNVKMYLNGEQKYSATHTINNWIPSAGDQNISLRIGSVWSSTQCFYGMIDSVALWKSVLSDTDIERLYNNGRGRMIESKTHLALFATPGEYEAGSFCIKALVSRGLSNVDISIPNDLINADLEEIPKENIKIQVVRLMKRWLSPVEYEKVECYLEDSTAESINQNETKRYWVTVEVPNDTEPGIYTSQIRIAPQGKAVKYLPISVEVFPFGLTDISIDGDIGNFMYYIPSILPENLRTQAKQLTYFEDMKNHGMTSASLYLYPQNNDLSQTVSGFLPTIATMNTLEQSGLIKNDSPVLWIGCESYADSVWKLMLDATVANDWPEMIFYAVDEPDASKMDRVIAFYNKLDDFKDTYPQYNDVRNTTAGADYASARSYYDVWIADMLRICDPQDNVIATAGSTGKELWSYECGLAPSCQEIDRYYFGLLFWKAGLKGAAHWVYYDGNYANRFGSYVNIDGTETNTNPDNMCYFSYVFPTATKIISSVGWEGVREGVDDYRYIQTLLSAMDESQDPVLVAKAEDLLDDISEQINISRYRVIYDAAQNNGRQHGFKFDRAAPELDLSPSDYNMLRYLIADMIKRLKQ